MRNNRGAIEISLSAVVLVLLFIVGAVGIPLYLTAQKHDNSIVVSAQKATDELVNKIIVTGKITQEDLDTYQVALDSGGYHWDYEMVVQILDENPVKKSVKLTKDGKTFYVMYDTQVKDIVEEKGEMQLDAQTQVTVSATLITDTMSDELAGASLGGKNKGIGSKSVQCSGTVTGQGN